MELIQFVNKYIDSPLISEKYKKYFTVGRFENTAKIVALLQKAIDDKDEFLLDCMLLIANEDGLNNNYTDIFKILLKEDWHSFHEDIIMYFADIKDPNSVNAIYDATMVEADNYIEDPCPITKKSIWTLGIINTDEAIEKIKLLSLSSNINIKETALMELDKFNS